MTRGELRRRWRSRVKDTKPQSYLWSEEDFDTFLDEAIVEAARRAHLIVDSSSDLTQVSLVAGELSCPLDTRIIFIRRARLVTARRRLSLALTCDLDQRVPDWESAAASSPLVYVPDWQSGALAVWPPSSIDDTLALTVVREPLAGLESDAESPEIAPRYHLSLLDWVSYRAYSDQDADGADPKAAEKALTAFELEFGTRAGAINEAFSLANYSLDDGDFQ